MAWEVCELASVVVAVEELASVLVGRGANVGVTTPLLGTANTDALAIGV